MKLTIGVCCYGDHADLARRCLDSIFRQTVQHAMSRVGMQVQSICIGANACSQATINYLYGIRSGHPVRILRSDKNVFKDPLMRLMIHRQDIAEDADWFMWFDDDSYFRRTDDVGGFWRRWREAADAADVLGSIYHIWPAGQQLTWLNAQKWCKTPRKPGYRFSFPTGGWWCGRLPLLRSWNYPFPEMVQGGDDVVLGELCAQHGARVRQWRDGVAINADADGNDCKSKRRGSPEAAIGVRCVDPQPVSEVSLDALVWMQPKKEYL